MSRPPTFSSSWPDLLSGYRLESSSVVSQFVGCYHDIWSLSLNYGLQCILNGFDVQQTISISRQGTSQYSQLAIRLGLTCTNSLPRGPPPTTSPVGLERRSSVYCLLRVSTRPVTLVTPFSGGPAL